MGRAGSQPFCARIAYLKPAFSPEIAADFAQFTHRHIGAKS